MIGTTLSHYRIVEELGRGGMGIVYKAEDTKLDRTVALKILPAAALASEDDRARFYREAKAAAQLNHPHIAAVHEIDEAVPEGAPSDDLRPFIAMEFIDGKSLEDKGKEGPMELEEVVRLTTQIAQALEAAHEKNIVHRDIKSANVMLTAKGQAKVLDFGLAKTAHSTMLTRMGSTLGTVAYMSPEQARGEDVDHRTDLWALGVMMYELVSGRLPFGGDYEQAVTYSILNEDPQPLTAIRTGVPMGLEWIVSKLLAKTADDRYQHAKDLLVDLRTVDLTQVGMSRATSVKSMPAAMPEAGNNGTKAFNVQPAIWLAIIAIVAVAGWWLGASSEPVTIESSVKRISQPLPVGSLIATLDISEDGRYVAYATETINILDLTSGSIRTYDTPDVYVHLAFSPDSRRLLLTTATHIKILSLDSGSIIDVMEPSEGGPRAEWVDGETIIFEDIPSIYERSLTTGAVRQVAQNDSLAGEYDMDFPTLLPDGKTMMATVQRREAADRIGFYDLASGKNRGYLEIAALRARYIDSGHIVYVSGNNLFAIPFDLNSFEQTGPVIPIAEDARVEGVAVSAEGTLVHVGLDVGVVSNARPVTPIVVEMTGGSFSNVFADLDFPSAIYRSADIHPGGTLAAVTIEQEVGDNDEPPTDIWILDFETGSRRAFTNDGLSDFPVWNASGDSLYFVRRSADDAGATGQRTILAKALSGTGSERIVRQTGNSEIFDLAMSPVDGTTAFAGGIPTSMEFFSDFSIIDLWDSTNNEYRMDILAEELDGPGGNPRMFAFSPDGRYLAFEDQGAIHVQSVENTSSPPYLIWENGKTLPKWSADGTMLYALNVGGGGESVPVSLDSGFSVTGPSVDMTQFWYAFGWQFFDAFPDNKRFLFGLPQPIAPEEEEEGEGDLENNINLNFIINLPAELSRGSR